MCPSNYNRFWDRARYCSKIVNFFIPLLHSTPPLGVSRWNTANLFGMEKLEWLGYHMVKKFLRRYLYSFWRNSRMWQTDGLTDGHRMPAIAALCIASHGKNVKRVSVKPEKISWNFWNLSEIFQGKKNFMKFYITRYEQNRDFRQIPRFNSEMIQNTAVERH